MLPLPKYTLPSVMGLAVVLWSCSSYNKLLKNGDNGQKKAAALEYYDKKDYIKSVALLEEVMPYYKLTAEGSQLYFTFCTAHYRMGDYYLAGHYFKRFIRQYPGDKYIEEATFLSALCAVNSSPHYKLDQTETLNALDELQIFIDLYPESSRVDTCNHIMDDLRKKLEKKQFENAQLYFKTEQYRAAVVALEGMLEKYPSSTYREEVLYLTTKSRYLLAVNSITAKKEERLKATLESYRNFVDAFPASSWKKEMKAIQLETERQLDRL